MTEEMLIDLKGKLWDEFYMSMPFGVIARMYVDNNENPDEPPPGLHESSITLWLQSVRTAQYIKRAIAIIEKEVVDGK